MERAVARAVNRLGDDDFELFGPADRPAFFELLEEYFCGDDPNEIDSGECACFTALPTVVSFSDHLQT